MKNILILGAGYTIKPMVDYFLDRCKYRVVMATRTVSKAETAIKAREGGKAIFWTTDRQESLDRLVSESDIVMVMIPRSGHYRVAEACIKYGKPMITTDFMHERIMAYDEAARKAGSLIMTELGEDPGLDNMGAKQTIDRIKAEGGKITQLTSYGAGLPSFENNNNPFGYKFSWDPKGLMRSAVSPAAMVVNGQRIEIPKKFEAHRLVDVYGIGTFETYPSNDSSRYIELFGLEDDVTIYKGLLRFIGWCNTITAFLDLGLIENNTRHDLKNMTYANFMAALTGLELPGNILKHTADKLNIGIKDDIIKRMEWLGLFSDNQIPTAEGTCSDVLVDLMLTKMAYAPGEKDMIIVHNEVDAEFPGRTVKRISSMMVEGIPKGDTAMARAVSLPAAIAARLILERKIEGAGVMMPNRQEIYRPILEEMKSFGYEFKTTSVEF